MRALTPIRSVFVANRGEVARRIIRTCRKLGLDVYVPFSDSDARLPFVREADRGVRLHGDSALDTYLRGDLLVEAALRLGADAVHPGYGFLAESAPFARACAEAGLTFIGPSPEVIETMGSKITAKEFMARAGVPLLETVRVTDPGAVDVDAVSASVGYPLLVKADMGGGGKAMHVVRSSAGLRDALDTARREAKAAFGDEGLFIEPYMEGSRHIEVQVIGDTAGNVAHLVERDCSVQRRHQKVVEEAPAPHIDAGLRRQICDAAVAGARSLGYVGVGTFEFLVTPTGRFAFLEVNTRLQVEHPVTEEILGIDLVAAQIRIAEGALLADVLPELEIDGHAVEARLYAEDPARGYLPQTGRLHNFSVPRVAGVRVDTGVASGSEISPFYDPMIAKVIAHGATRQEAISRLVAALRGAELDGLRTNRDFLVRLLSCDEFQTGRVDTQFLDEPDSQRLTQPLVEEHLEARYAQVAALAGALARHAEVRVQRGLPLGWRNNPSQLTQTRLRSQTEHTVRYRVVGDSVVFSAEAGSETCRFTVTDRGLMIELDGVATSYAVRHWPGHVTVQDHQGSVDFEIVDLLPDRRSTAVQAGAIVAPMPGKILSVLCAVGSRVLEGELLLVMEAMKMEHRVTAPATGIVTQLGVDVGEQVTSGKVLVVVGDDGGE